MGETWSPSQIVRLLTSSILILPNLYFYIIGFKVFLQFYQFFAALLRKVNMG